MLKTAKSRKDLLVWQPATDKEDRYPLFDSPGVHISFVLAPQRIRESTRHHKKSLQSGKHVHSMSPIFRVTLNVVSIAIFDIQRLFLNVLVPETRLDSKKQNLHVDNTTKTHIWRHSDF